MNEKTIKMLIQLGVVLLSVARDLQATSGLEADEIAVRNREKIDNAIAEGESWLAEHGE